MNVLAKIRRAPKVIGALAAILLGLGTYFHFLARMSYGFATSILLIGILVVFAALIVANLFTAIPLHYRESWSGRRGLGRVSWALALGLFAGLVLPLHVRPIKPVSLAITALGTHHPDAKGTEVWVRLEADGRDIPPQSITKDGKWSINGNMAISASPQQPATLEWSGQVRTLRLYFVGHAWSGIVRIVQDGVAREVDLYRPPGKDGQVEIDLLGRTVDTAGLHLPQRNGVQWLGFAVDAWLIGGLLVILFDLARGITFRADGPVPVDPPRQRILRSDYVFFSLPPFLAYLGYLLLFFPGIMTGDSVDQWEQSSSGLYSDWHPPAYGLMMAAMRAVWDSPAAIASLQVVVMSLAIGVLLTMARAAAAAPRWLAFLGAICCAAYPMVGLSTITLWKDVLYSAAVVFLIGYTIGLVCLRLPLLSRVGWLLSAFLALFVCLSFRYNGLPFVLLALGCIAVAVPAERWRAVLLFAVGILTVHVFNGPVLDAMGTIRSHVSFTIAAHHIAAHQSAGEAMPTEEDVALIRRIWPGPGVMPYNCAYSGTTIFDPRFDAITASRSYRQLANLAGRMALAHPGVELKHLICVSALVWRMSKTGDEPMLAVGASGVLVQGDSMRWVGDNSVGLKEQPTLGHLGDRIRLRLYHLIDNESMRRPAFFLYLLIFAGTVTIGRQRRWELGGTVALAVLAQSGSIMLFNVAQDPRYQLPVVIAGLALAPVLLASRRVTASSATTTDG